MYTNSTINQRNWKQAVLITIFSLLAWQLTTASVFALEESRIIGYVFGGNDVSSRVSGAEIILYDVDNALVDATMTDGDGSYAFTVTAGEYTIQNTINGETLEVTIRPNVAMVGLDFYNAGNEGVASGLALTAIAGNVYTDHDAEMPAEGVEISLLDGDGNVVTSSTTDADGNYMFTAVPGAYTLQNSTNNQILRVSADAGTTMVGVDFYNSGLPMSQEPAAIIGYVFGGHDTSIRAGDVEILLFDSDDNLVDGALTRANGNYRFDVAPGTYTLQNSTNNQILIITVEPGTVIVGVDFYNSGSDGATFGLVADGAPTSQIIGNMYAGHDGDVLVINSDVELLTSDGIPVIDAAGSPIVATTNSRGEYAFNVVPGSYILRNPENNQILRIEIDTGVTLVGVDFYNAAPTPSIPLAVSLNNVATNGSVMSVTLLMFVSFLGIATLPMVSKKS